MKLMHKLLASRKGYTIDQTILIIAIIAILITLIILTIAWALINRSSGTRAGSQLNQLEDANGQFFSAQKIWPTDVTTDSKVAVSALAGFVDATGGADAGAKKNYINGFKGTATSVQNGYGGTIEFNKAKADTSLGVGTTQNYLVVTFPSIPLADAREADKAIDGSDTPASGRLYITKSGTSCLVSSAAKQATATSETTVTACFLANAID